MRPVDSPSRRVHPGASTVERGGLHRLERGERRISEHEEVLEETEPTPTQRYRASVLAQIDKVVLQPSQPPPSQKAVAKLVPKTILTQPVIIVKKSPVAAVVKPIKKTAKALKAKPNKIIAKLNNKQNNKTLNKVKKTAKAILPKKPASKTTN